MIYETLDPILFSTSTADMEQFALRITDEHDTQVLRSGDAVILLNEPAKEQMRIDAQFRPCLRSIPTMTETEFTATDTETVLQVIRNTVCH